MRSHLAFSSILEIHKNFRYLYKGTPLSGIIMGRIKTTYIKRRTKELLKLHGDKFATTFEQNKLSTSQYTKTASKKLRNIVAGYMTRLKRKEQ